LYLHEHIAILVSSKVKTCSSRCPLQLLHQTRKMVMSVEEDFQWMMNLRHQHSPS